MQILLNNIDTIMYLWHMFSRRDLSTPRSFVWACIYLPIIARDTPPMGFLRCRGPSELDAVTRGPSESENYIGGATHDRGFADERTRRTPLLRRRLSIERARRTFRKQRGSEEKSYIPSYQLQLSASGHKSLSLAISHFEVTCIKGVVEFAFAAN